MFLGEEFDDAEAAMTQVSDERRVIRRRAAVRHPIRRVRALMARQRGLTLAASEPVGADEILRRVAQLPISTWAYGFDHPSVRHMGPMAQDFAATFGLGSSDRRIDLVDANGVLFVAVQALHRRVTELEHDVVELKAQPARS